MHGPEHYREAERLLAEANGYHPGVDTADKLAEAQVHATLALAAATALAGPLDNVGERVEWNRVAGVK